MTAEPALRPRDPTPALDRALLDDLPCSDGWPMDSPRHRFQMNLLIDSVEHHWRDRKDFYTGGDMFVYPNQEHALKVKKEVEADISPQRSKYSRGPDFYVILGVDGSYDRKSWKAWEEGGRLPDLVVELLSKSTRARDLGQKKNEYERIFRTREYFVWEPDRPESFQGWRLGPVGYRPIEEDDRGFLWSEVMGLWLGSWDHECWGHPGPWLRFFDEEGRLVYTPREAEWIRAEEERRKAEEERRKVEEERRKVEEERRKVEEERRKVEEERRKVEEERMRAEKERMRAEAAEAENVRLRALLAGREGEES